MKTEALNAAKPLYSDFCCRALDFKSEIMPAEIAQRRPIAATQFIAPHTHASIVRFHGRRL